MSELERLGEEGNRDGEVRDKMARYGLVMEGGRERERERESEREREGPDK